MLNPVQHDVGGRDSPGEEHYEDLEEHDEGWYGDEPQKETGEGSMQERRKQERRRSREEGRREEITPSLTPAAVSEKKRKARQDRKKNIHQKRGKRQVLSMPMDEAVQRERDAAAAERQKPERRKKAAKGGTMAKTMIFPPYEQPQSGDEAKGKTATRPSTLQLPSTEPVTSHLGKGYFLGFDADGTQKSTTQFITVDLEQILDLPDDKYRYNQRFLDENLVDDIYQVMVTSGEATIRERKTGGVGLATCPLAAWSDALGPYMTLARASTYVYDAVMNVYAAWERGHLPRRDVVKPATKLGEAGKAQKPGPGYELKGGSRIPLHWIQGTKGRGYLVPVHDPYIRSWKSLSNLGRRERLQLLHDVLGGEVILTPKQSKAAKDAGLHSMESYGEVVKMERAMLRMFHYFVFILDAAKKPSDWREPFFMDLAEVFEKYRDHGLTYERWVDQRQHFKDMQWIKSFPPMLGGDDEKGERGFEKTKYVAKWTEAVFEALWRFMETVGGEYWTLVCFIPRSCEMTFLRRVVQWDIHMSIAKWTRQQQQKVRHPYKVANLPMEDTNRMVVIIYSNDGDYHRNTILLFEDIQLAQPSSSSQAIDTLTLARRERKPKLLTDVAEKKFQPTKHKSADKAVMFLGKGHAALVWELLKSHRHCIVLEGEDMKFDFLVQFVNTMVDTREYQAKFVKPPPRHDEARDFVHKVGKNMTNIWEFLFEMSSENRGDRTYNTRRRIVEALLRGYHKVSSDKEIVFLDRLEVMYFDAQIGAFTVAAYATCFPEREHLNADDSEEESVDGTLQAGLASERQKVTPSSSQKMVTAGTSSRTPSIGTSGVVPAGGMTLPVGTPPAGTAHLAAGMSSSAGMVSDPAAVFRVLFGADASPELISSFQGLAQIPALLQQLLSQTTQAAHAKELEYEYEIGNTIPADVAQLVGPIVCRDDHTRMEADKWGHDVVWHPRHYQPALAKGKWVMAIKEDGQWQFCSHRGMAQSRFYAHEENQIRQRLARLNPNVSPSRVDIRTNEVFQELKALRRLEYLEEFYDRQTSPAFGYNWRIDDADETGGKRGQGPSGGASGEGGEHPSGDEGGGDEGRCDKGGSGEGEGTSEAPRYSHLTTGTSEGQAHRHHEGSASGVGGHIDIRGLPQVTLSTAVEQVDEECEGGQSVTTTLTGITVTDNEWCDGSGASVFPVGEKGDIGSPQGHMWMSMDILPYGLGSQGRLRALLDETMYLAETEQQLEAHTPLD
ncbi:hypothetical protein CBR_g39350 [Chara braunii]|uniref:Uncharacterized protein n=1 Tax=Chara braunii TaxID=69332 RepID=A0A388LRC4_CHABU|nr:hypothetical protein CBR_g39350 [Chara braunii]|eukprot:GBG84888.1 hypothetical protein CBR_g39350 [Chara braunii]